MERHIGIWYREPEKEKKDVGELLIDGNHIEFYSRFQYGLFKEAFIGNDGDRSYKVVVQGRTKPGENRILDYTSPHRVYYVLMQNYEFPKGTDISGITDFSFTIPELIDWLGLKTVDYCYTEDDEPAALEIPIDSIIIKESSPRTELYFESRTYESIFSREDRTTITVKKEPRIRVVYDQPVNVEKVVEEIKCLMQFLGLLNGKVSFANDIRLSFEGQDAKSWLYINYDFSYNCTNYNIIDEPRTYYYVVEEKLIEYYSKWYDFFCDDKYRLIRNVYFSVNGRRDIFLENVFVEYMRFLDGYHLIRFGGAEIEEKLKAALKSASKEIKSQLFTDENKLIFEKAIQGVLPDWRFNSSNIGDISTWIASGYIAKKSLSHRLKELDEIFYNIIKNNALSIEKTSQLSEKLDSITDDKVIELYYKELGDTRNYYSHYKQDKTGVLDSSQIAESINVLKATIIAILLSHMGIDPDLIRRILLFDRELDFQTMFLRKDNDKPFLHPKYILEKTDDEEKNDASEEKYNGKKRQI